MALDKVTNEAALDFLVKSGYSKIDEATKVESDTIELDSLTEEEVAKHVCPLCESYVEEGISDEAILEHYNSMMEVVDELSEESEDSLTEQEELVAKAAAYDELVVELESQE